MDAGGALVACLAVFCFGIAWCQTEGLPTCHDGTIFHGEKYCANWVEAYDVDWSTNVVVNLDVTCSVIEDESTIENLGNCRDELRKGEYWEVMWGFSQVNFLDAYGAYQASEWNVLTEFGERNLDWPSKVLPDGKCYEGDGYCRKKKKCKITGTIRGAVREIEDSLCREHDTDTCKVHDWGDHDESLMKPLWSPRVKEYWKFSKEIAGCVACPVVPCEGVTCPNGRVLGRLAETVAGAVVKRPVCEKECSAGTFLTCRTRDTCGYQPLTDAQAAADGSGYRRWYDDNVKIESDLNIVPVGQLRPPYLDCYPCKFADRRAHGGVALMTESGQASKGFLSFFCPGGAKLPEDCPVNQVTKVDPVTNMTSVCGCKNGMVFNDVARECQPCKAGHYCAWSGMSPPREVECPLDYYAESGWDACKKCDTRRQCDAGQALTRCLPSKASGRSGEYQTHDSECVNCAECQQLSAARDSVPCYKVSPIIGFG
jgi:hypothetical protein